jgi:hypothetical protein
MKIDNVDDLLVDILGVPDHAVHDAKGWLEITEMFEKAIAAADDLLIIDTETDHYEDCQPYIQICFEDDGAMTIEAVSNEFLQPGLSPDAQHTMAELGWQLSDDDRSPNYFQFLHKEDAAPRVIAELFAKTFRIVYGITPADTIEVSLGKGLGPSESENAKHE